MSSNTSNIHHYRYFEFNKNTLDYVSTDEYKNLIKTKKNSEIEVNYAGDLIRQKWKRDPQGRGSKIYKETLRGYVDIVLPDGSVKKAIRKIKPRQRVSKLV